MNSTVKNSENLDDLLECNFTNEFRTGYINVKGVCLPEYFQKFQEAIENFEVRDDDVWVCSFPKTGTTWTQEMVWCIANDLDFDGAKSSLLERFPFLELSIVFDHSSILSRNPNLNFPEYSLDSVSYVAKKPSSRFIKTHLPFHLLPKQLRNGEKKAKIIYVSRNPKDTCISFFHHCTFVEGYKGNFDTFCELFLAGKLTFAPFWENILSYWSRREENNILFLKFEDLKTGLPKTINQIAKFLGKEELTGERLRALLDHLSFEKMKLNSAVNYKDFIDNIQKCYAINAKGSFIRSGKTNEWKERMSEAMISRFDEWASEHLEGTGFEM